MLVLFRNIESIRSAGDFIVVTVLYLVAVALGICVVGFMWRLDT